MLHIKFQGHRPFGSGEEDFLRFLPYMGMRPSWSCDQGRLNKLLFPHPMETSYEIWLQPAQWFLRRRCFKSVDDRRTAGRTTEAYLSYKLTNEPSAQVSKNFYIVNHLIIVCSLFCNFVNENLFAEI